MLTRQVLSIRFLWAIGFLFLCAPVGANNSPDVPVADGGLGSCRAAFTVKDEGGKPIYDAKIGVTIKYGFFNKLKTAHEGSRSSDGQAALTGLPDAAERPS